MTYGLLLALFNILLLFYRDGDWRRISFSLSWTLFKCFSEFWEDQKTWKILRCDPHCKICYIWSFIWLGFIWLMYFVLFIYMCNILVQYTVLVYTCIRSYISRVYVGIYFLQFYLITNLTARILLKFNWIIFHLRKFFWREEN